MELTFAFIGLCCTTVVAAVSAAHIVEENNCIRNGNECVDSHSCCYDYCHKDPGGYAGVCQRKRTKRLVEVSDHHDIGSEEHKMRDENDVGQDEETTAAGNEENEMDEDKEVVDENVDDRNLEENKDNGENVDENTENESGYDDNKAYKAKYNKVGDNGNNIDSVTGEASTDLDAECLPIGSGHCVDTANCCNGYCDKEPDEDYGKCRERLAESAIIAFTKSSFGTDSKMIKPMNCLCKVYEKSNDSMTDSGDFYDPQSMIAAHPTVPLDTLLFVLVGTHGVVVRIVDQLPLETGYKLMVSPAAAKALGIVAGQLVKCTIRVTIWNDLWRELKQQANEVEAAKAKAEAKAKAKAEARARARARARAKAEAKAEAEGKPRTDESKKPCKEDWVGDCFDDEDCCSEACSRSPYLKATEPGICVPKNVKGDNIGWA